ncbi:MAG: Ig-like domain repeat protein, partial [Bifidobacteriaceae bacterium]|nr:Ig-like domain repeat protein [Bifidobacteriaceae bacterium]
RNGKPIAGATGVAYKVTAADAGASIVARATLTKAGAKSVTLTTTATEIPKLRPTVKAKLAKKSIKASARAKVTVTVKVSGVAGPAGKVKVKFGKKTKTYTLKAASNGKRTVKLPKLKKGAHKIKGTFMGTQQIERRTSKTVKLKVR